jgi:hypothetical protein
MWYFGPRGNLDAIERRAPIAIVEKGLDAVLQVAIVQIKVAIRDFLSGSGINQQVQVRPALAWRRQPQQRLEAVDTSAGHNDFLLQANDVLRYPRTIGFRREPDYGPRALFASPFVDIALPMTPTATDFDDDPSLAGLLDAWSLRLGVCNLNHGSFGPSPRVVQQARAEWAARLEKPADGLSCPGSRSGS